MEFARVQDNCEECKFSTDKHLSPEEQCKLEIQNSRLVSIFHASKLEVDAKKNWDLFYKRNETRFFKDRRWTTREFKELVDDGNSCSGKVLLEIGCGVGNLIFPLLEEEPNMFIHACDLSPRAIDFVKRHPSYCRDRINAFQCDITTEEITKELGSNTVDIVTLVFVFSSIHPDKFRRSLVIIKKLLKPGGIVLFRDYGLYDMTQLRFKPGHKISENLYMRQDGTRLV
ncbi:Methyltransferase-like protein 6 [Blattella germanica]|nr:Methyltransferase-like protein 6 [Blattella germanica]